MKGTTIYDRGFEVEIDVIPDIGTPAVNEVFEKVNRKLTLGKSVSLSDIQEMLGVRGGKRSAHYRLDPYVMRNDEIDYDWQYLFQEDPAVGRTVYGRKVIIWGLADKRTQSFSKLYKQKKARYNNARLDVEDPEWMDASGFRYTS